MPIDWSPLWLSVRYAALATLLASALALPLAWLLAHRRFPASELLNAAASLPLLLPPAVLVYYLLARSQRWPIVFEWRTAVAVSAIYTLPLLFGMSRAGMEAVDHNFENAARSLATAEWRIFWRITLPLAWRALLAALLAGFARAFVDFGATVVVSRTGNDWILVVVAAAGFGALYAANRTRVRA